MHKKFEINWTKIKGSCQSGKKVVPHNSMSNLPLPNIPNITDSTRFITTVKTLMFTTVKAYKNLVGEH